MSHLGSLKSASSSMEVKARNGTSRCHKQDQRKMHFSSSPLVAQVILANTSQLAKDLIPQPIEAFKIFDQASKNVKACTSLCQIIFFLWGAVHHKIPPITMAFDSSPTGSSWAIALHSACIIQTTHYHNQQETQSRRICQTLTATPRHLQTSARICPQ
jgi:hypothetical protein